MEGELRHVEGGAATTSASVGVQLEEGHEDSLIDMRGRDPFEAHLLALDPPRETSELTDEGGRGAGATVGERQLHAWACGRVHDAGPGGQGPRGPVRIGAADEHGPFSQGKLPRPSPALRRERARGSIACRRGRIFQTGKAAQ
jgi:hypothetical protein